MTTIVNYKITLNDPLSIEEMGLLKDCHKLYSIMKPDFMPHYIDIDKPSDMNEREFYSSIAEWVSRIGDVTMIHSIEENKVHYTDFVSEEVKDLMRA